MLRTAVLTTIAMLAFAANSVLCRLALGEGLIDAASFTTIRLASGALVLALVCALRRTSLRGMPDRRMVLALLAYMVFFSWAYLSLTTATGALVLFGTVQLTMFGVSLVAGARYSPVSWTGALIAMGGLIYLLLPGVRAPDPVGAVMMTIAGIAWGLYSLLGRGSANPTRDTALNFVYATPVAVLLSLLTLENISVQFTGAVYAVLSGALASGAGYAIWYAALKNLQAGQAATVQLTVPVIAAIGGVIFVAEPFGMRLAIASALVLGGVLMVLVAPTR